MDCKLLVSWLDWKMQDNCCKLIISEGGGRICKRCRIATEYTILRKLACKLRVLLVLIWQNNFVVRFIEIKIVHLLAIVLELRWYPEHNIVVERRVGYRFENWDWYEQCQ